MDYDRIKIALAESRADHFLLPTALGIVFCMGLNAILTVLASA